MSGSLLIATQNNNDRKKIQNRKPDEKCNPHSQSGESKLWANQWSPRKQQVGKIDGGSWLTWLDMHFPLFGVIINVHLLLLLQPLRSEGNPVGSIKCTIGLESGIDIVRERKYYEKK